MNAIQLYLALLKHELKHGHHFDKLKSYFGWWYRLKSIFIDSPIDKVLNYEGDDLCGYLIAGTNIDRKELQAVINRIKRDEGYKTNSAAGELTAQVRTKALSVVKYAIDNQMTVAVAYFTVKNNKLWLR